MFQHLPRRFRERAGDEGNAPARDRRLLAGDVADGGPETVGVLQVDPGHAGGDRPADAGRVEPCPDPRLDHRDVHRRIGEGAERGGGQHIEECGGGVRIGAVQCRDGGPDPLQGLDERAGVDGRSPEPDPLVPGFEMG